MHWQLGDPPPLFSLDLPCQVCSTSTHLIHSHLGSPLPVRLPLESPCGVALTRLATNIPGPVNLDRVPKEYHDFADIFSKSKASILANHCPYDLKITLEEGASPPPSDQATCYLRRNYSPSISSLMRIQPWDLSVPHALHMEHQCSSYERRTDPCNSVVTFGG